MVSEFRLRFCEVPSLWLENNGLLSNLPLNTGGFELKFDIGVDKFALKDLLMLVRALSLDVTGG